MILPMGLGLGMTLTHVPACNEVMLTFEQLTEANTNVKCLFLRYLYLKL